MPPYTRWQRGARAISGFASGTSRLARPPRQLVRPAVRPGGCVPPSPLLIHDNFDRPSYSPEPNLGGSTSTSGHTWVQYRGTHKVGLRPEPGSGPNNSVAFNFDSPGGIITTSSYVGFDYGTADVHLAARCAGGSGDGSRGIFLCFNNSADVDDTEVYVYNAEGGVLTKRLPSGLTTIATTGGGNVDGAVLEVIKSGGDFELYIDGVLEGTGNDPSPLTHTRHGIVHRFADTAADPESIYDWGYPYNPCDPDAFV